MGESSSYFDATIAYGSNAGSSETLARRLQQQGRLHGFAPKLVPMDALVDGLENAELLAIVTASYEGEPPDNAKKFVPFLEALPEQSLSHISYSVFGCRNRQWARTIQAIPKRVDGAYSVAGANQIHNLGIGDSGGDFFGAFEDWSQGFWEGAFAIYAKPKPDISNRRPVHISFIPEDGAATL